MKSDEFKRWLAHHVARFPGVSTWLKKFPQVGTDQEVTQEGILKAWRDALSPVELGDAVDASDMLFDGREPRPPAYESHPSAVRSLAFRIRDGRTKKRPPQGVSGDPREPACKLCRDAGAVTIWHPRTVQAVSAGETNSADYRNRYKAVARCHCAAAKSRFASAAVYDPGTHYSLDLFPTFEQLEAAVHTGRAWVA